MAKVQFFSQKMIDQWVAERKVEFDGNTLNILMGKKGTYTLHPASMVLEVIDGVDHKKLKGKVLTPDHIKALKADLYLDTALVEEVAYKVEPGFITASAVPAPIAAEKKEKTEPESLADLMLKSLSGNS